ncbi:MAG: 16S rRNA (adenine(1518)-N(6)/adenine(1519)-N(6))-dimethyltransferase RsmA [Pseudomonadota bacterium]|nr:16S rRNA (adenine(1518)-N(6)/adenine(1519)-N(6))-dimethyltransferase RsmA [Pseudomonadota bacterium]
MLSESLPPLREVIARHGLKAKKALGQNFLLDLNLTRRIARSALPLQGHTVVEVGPGPGGLTRALLIEGAGRIVAVERDERALPAIAEIAAAYPGRLEVIFGNALKTDWAALVKGPSKVVANLPYNIATALLVDWLTGEIWPPWYQSLTLMFQREVAERITAAPGGKAYGRLSVLAQWRASAVRLFDVGPRAFTPPPKVTSSVVLITPQLPIESRCRMTDLEKITQLAFGQRRKKLRSSLKLLWKNPDAAIASAGVDPNLRAEQLSVADFCRLAVVLRNGTAGA